MTELGDWEIVSVHDVFDRGIKFSELSAMQRKVHIRVEGRRLDILNYPDRHQGCAAVCNQPEGCPVHHPVLLDAHERVRRR